jgi:hypothetical protein
MLAKNRRSGSVAASRRARSNASRASSWRPRRRNNSARVEWTANKVHEVPYKAADYYFWKSTTGA